MSVIGHNQKPHVSVNSLSQIDKDKLKGAIREMNDSMTRVAAERELQKEIVTKICDELGLDKKLVKRMAKVYFKANFNDEIEENKTFEDFYTIVMNVSNNT
jgi:ABC-type microcin C transport system permease subunit YejB